MSTFTARQFAVKARQYLTEQEEAAAGFSVPMLRSLVDDALNDVARDVAMDPLRRHLMRTDPATTTISVVAGVADISTLLSTNKVFLEFIKTADIKGANDRGYQWIATLNELRLKRRTDNFYTFFTVEGTNLYTRNNGALTDLNETPAVSASFQATVAQMKSELDSDLVVKIAARAMNTLTSRNQKIAAAAIGRNAA